MTYLKLSLATLLGYLVLNVRGVVQLNLSLSE